MPLKQVSFTSPYGAEEESILRRQKMAEMLQQQGNTPLGPTEMVGGWAVPRSPLEGAAKLAQSAAGSYQMAQADARRKELIRQMQGDAANWYGNAPKAQPASAPGFGGEPEQPTGGMTQPTDQQKMQHLMTGMQNPYSAPIAQMQLAQMMKAQEPRVIGEGGVLLGPDNKPVFENKKDFRPPTPPASQLSTLLAEKAALTPGDPRHAIYDNAIRKASETAKQISPTIVMPKPDKVPMGYRVTADGNLEAIPGGPADLKAQAEAQRKSQGAGDVDVALGTLRNAYNKLEEGGGITSVKKEGLGNVIPSISSSPVGQAAGKLFGTQNQSARNDIAMARPALLAALMKATGMSAKQMDSNAELKLWLSTATDPTLDVESNRRALDAIEKKYLSGAAVKTTPAPEKPLSDVEKAELDALRKKLGR